MDARCGGPIFSTPPSGCVDFMQERIVVSRPSDHFDGSRFTNPGGETAGQPWTLVPRLLAEQARWERWPAMVPVTPRRPTPRGDAAASVTFIGHSTFLIQTALGNVLTDPVYSSNAGPFGRFGPGRHRAPGVAFEDLPVIAVIALSHNHYDHCDLPTLRRLAKRDDPLVVTALGNARTLRRAGFSRIEELDWWEKSASSPIPIAATPARHFSSRTMIDRNRALWCGFMIGAASRQIYFAGDSAYSPFFREIPARLGRVDLALIPIGAYEPRWFMNVVHMNPAEAVQAHVDVRAERSVGMHFGTFQLTAEGIDAPVEALGTACAAAGIQPGEFSTLDSGETLTL
jgi:L-ascorbate metabolism protein UlaG (beta-lactamase superfamily)